VTTSEQAGYREPPWSLHAEWTATEADLHAAARALPGAQLTLVRWPVAFFVAFTGVGLSDPKVGPAFAVGAGAVIAALWIVILLGSRGTALRREAGVPVEQRTLRLHVDGERLRLEVASGSAAELPSGAVTHARAVPAGVLLHLGNQVLFVPSRALQGSEAAWRAFAERFAARPWPSGLRYTAGLWIFALMVAGYAFVK
jgi:hypothetical protein